MASKIGRLFGGLVSFAAAAYFAYRGELNWLLFCGFWHLSLTIESVGDKLG